MIQGGGGFLLRARGAAAPEALDALGREIAADVWREFGGEVAFSLGWGSSPEQARARLEREKRRPGAAALTSGTGWTAEAFSLAPLGRPCEVCGRRRGERSVAEDDEEVWYCTSCFEARRLGETLARSRWASVAEPGRHRCLGVGFEFVDERREGAFLAVRHIPRDPKTQQPATFEEIAGLARGERRLAVLKADVDDMGVRVGEVARADPTLRRLREFSCRLQRFFGDDAQELMRRDWPAMYTVYAGGDDLLAVGPWDVALDFAAAMARAFAAGPAREFGPLTLSAGVALTPYRTPIRHAAGRAEELLETAKGRAGKNRCAALGADWSWDRQETVIGDGKRLAEWVDGRIAPRSFVYRLYCLAESQREDDAGLAAARWTDQVFRNLPAARNEPEARREFRQWARGQRDVLESGSAAELSASLRYALLATRTKGRDSDG